MLAVPPALLEVLNLTVGNTVGLVVDKGRLVIEPKNKARYTLEELLAQCDASAELCEEDQNWTQSTSLGSELL